MTPKQLTARPIALILALLATLALAACGSSDDDTGSSTGGSRAGVETGALPVTISHKFGSTTVTEQPERVVVAGLREQDALLALGVVPVATTNWFGDHPGGIFPWAKDKLGDAPVPEVLDNTDGIQFERIAALKPDLIVAVYSGLTKKDYETLSKIAPTVAQPRDTIDFGSTWQQDITIVGQAIGKPKAAIKLRDATEKTIVDTAAKYPQFKGRSAAIATPSEGIFVYGPLDTRVGILESLGFKIPADLREVAGDEFGDQLSNEQVSRLDVDMMMWFANPGPAAKIKAHPVYSKLAVREEGRDLFLTEKGEMYDALNLVTVLSLPIVMEQLAPRIAKTLEGNAAKI